MTHFQERLMERYGIVCSDADEAAIAARCRDGDGLLAARDSTSETWLLRLGEHTARLVYCRANNRMITALATRALSGHQAGGVTRKTRLRHRREKKKRGLTL